MLDDANEKRLREIIRFAQEHMVSGPYWMLAPNGETWLWNDCKERGLSAYFVWYDKRARQYLLYKNFARAYNGTLRHPASSVLIASAPASDAYTALAAVLDVCATQEPECVNA